MNETIKIALLDFSKKEPDKLEEFMNEICIEHNLKEDFDYELISSFQPSYAPYLPLPIDNLVETVLAQQLFLAGQADITIYKDNGVIGNVKGEFLDRLHSSCDVMIGWTPYSIVDEDEGFSFIENNDVVKPGVVSIEGDIQVLAAYVCYIIGGR